MLVIDEAGMIGGRQMERVIGEAERRGAKVVLVGDPEQLQAIEAGAAFHSATERYGNVGITEVRRQLQEWQQQATRQLATGRTTQALEAYSRHDMVHAAPTREAARAELIDRWNAERQASPARCRIILTHTNDDVRTLNEAARARLSRAGELGNEVGWSTTRGEGNFAAGDQVMFLRNERELGVQNGTLGRIDSVTKARMTVMLDDGRSVGFDAKDYADLDHGYAATIHKAQGMTVDRVHVLATPGLDRHAAYVALSRHRESVQLHYGRDEFADADRLTATLSRERAKDMAQDHARDPSASLRRAFAERRQIVIAEPAVEKPAPARNPFAGLKLDVAPPPRPRSMIDGLKLSRAPLTRVVLPDDLERAVQNVGKAAADIQRMHRDGYTELPHQRTAYDRA